MPKTLGMRWLVMSLSATMLLLFASACTTTETIEVPGETVVVEKIITETVEVPGETVVVEKVVTETVEVPGETVIKEVIKEVAVPGETVVVEVVKEVRVPGETVVVEKEVVVEVVKEVVKEVEVQGKKYVTDPTTGKVVSAPEYGGTITMVWHSIPDTARNYPTRHGQSLLGGVSEMLTMADWGVDRSVFQHMNRPVPSWIMKGRLAESWEIKDGGTTYEFTLRDDVNWHNKAPVNGRKLVANDVVVSYQRYFGTTDLCPDGDVIGQYKNVPLDSITAADDRTVVFKLTRPHLSFLDDIFNAYPPHIQPPESIEKDCSIGDWRDVTGTGPFELAEVVKDTSATWTKFAGYYGFDEKFPANRLPYVDELKALEMPDDATRVSALRTGKIEYLGWSGDTAQGIDTARALMKTNPEMTFIPYIYRSNGTSYSLNIRTAPFDDIRVRKAMQMALDLEAVNNAMFGGMAKWKPQGIMGDGSTEYFTPFDEWPEDIKKGYVYDPEGAEKLLDEAGYPRGDDGIRFTTKHELGTYWKDQPLADLAASYWKKIGVEVKVTNAPDNAALNAKIKAGEFEGMVGAYIGYDRNPSFMMSCYARSDGGCNRPGTNDPAIDALIDAGLAATTYEQQQANYKEADMMVIRDHHYVWFLKIPKYNILNPWYVGYNGEYFLGFQQRYGQIHARIWIDSEMRNSMAGR